MSNIIDSIQLSGNSYDVKDKSATTVVALTQAEYNALPSTAKTANILYNITDAQGGDLSNYYTTAETQSAITEAVTGKVDTTAIVTAITSSSTDGQVPSAKCVYDQVGGLKLVKLTQSAYDALSPNYDSNTLYVING
jgi:hypothetical protein